jgi:hypothetical protein
LNAATAEASTATDRERETSPKNTFCRFCLSVRFDVVIALPAFCQANLFWYKHTGQPKKHGLQQYDALNWPSDGGSTRSVYTAFTTFAAQRWKHPISLSGNLRLLVVFVKSGQLNHPVPKQKPPFRRLFSWQNVNKPR